MTDEQKKACEALAEGYQKYHTLKPQYDAFKRGYEAAQQPDQLLLNPLVSALVEALRRSHPYVAMGVPEPSHFGTCTPETLCDMDCSNAFHGSILLADIIGALAPFRKGEL